MKNAELIHRIGCSECNYTGWLYLYTRPDHNGEPEEIEVKCDCTLEK